MEENKIIKFSKSNKSYGLILSHNNINYILTYISGKELSFYTFDKLINVLSFELDQLLPILENIYSHTIYVNGQRIGFIDNSKVVLKEVRTTNAFEFKPISNKLKLQNSIKKNINSLNKLSLDQLDKINNLLQETK